MTTTKLCKDCKYYKQETMLWFIPIADMCFGGGRISRINGKPDPYFCDTARWWSDLCGKEAKWFKEKFE